MRRLSPAVLKRRPQVVIREDHFLLGMAQQMVDELHANERVDSCAEVVDDNADALREGFEAADRLRLQDVEEAEEKERENRVRPVGWDGDECDELAGDLVDDDEARVFPA